MTHLHDDAYGAYELDYAAGEYALIHFADPGRKPSAVILLPTDVAVAQAQEILRRSAPHLLAENKPRMVATPEPGGNVVLLRRVG